MDNVIPSRGYQMTPMVALGGSAGGIKALVDFFRAMPSDSGMMFIVILHLSPTHQSTLAELLGRETKMPVVQAHDGQKAEANHVYVIPPGKYLTTVDGQLKLNEIEAEKGKRVAVDLFFRSLADTHGPHATAIVLSGVDGDGALGIKRIKERGGLTIAQEPDEAENSGMPQSAIATGMIDWVLSVGEMPRRILDYYRIGKQLKLPSEDGPTPVLQAKEALAQDDENESALREILGFVRMRTGRDFSYYKRATIVRRIGRRMQVNSVNDLAGYLGFLRTHPGEAGALLQDLLISVTNFFRDREVFEVLQSTIPQLFVNKTSSHTLRVWVPACATGEEAYSIAILLLEHSRTLENGPAIQVFACDLDDAAIQVARAGHYPDTINADISEDRLKKFFVKERSGFRVRRELREMILFASHDLLKDSPFSRMDLISCRNLLIYLSADAQYRAFEIFHFALKTGGVLLLGSSEVVPQGSELFSVLDKKNRIYEQRPAVRTGFPLPTGPGTLSIAIRNADETKHSAPVVHGKRFVHDAAAGFQSRIEPHLDRIALAELHFKLIERFGPPSVITNSKHEVMHLSQNVGKFLKFTAGEATNDILRLVSADFRAELRTLLIRATRSGGTAEVFGLSTIIDGKALAVDLRVTPANDIAPGALLITFDARRPTQQENQEANNSADTRANSERAMGHIEHELELVKSHLKDTVEQYEGSTEELKASNEELQAMNEELRSATEELETSREELQSINEELTTVNHEMKGKVDELANANSDLQNLMASTSIATIFLDRDLVITRFTPNAASIFNLIAGDIGRPLAHLKHHLDYPDLIKDADTVLKSLIPLEREVRDEDHWYSARIQPYRTVEDHIAGTVLTFVDITDLTKASEALKHSEDRLRMLIESSNDYAIFTTDCERKVDSWNKGAERLFGYLEHEILGQLADVLFTPEDLANGYPIREIEIALAEGRAETERWQVRKDGTRLYGSGSVMPLRDTSSKLRGFVKIMRDLTESKRTQEALQQHMEELTRFNVVAVGRETRMIELKSEINRLLARLGDEPRYALPEQEN